MCIYIYIYVCTYVRIFIDICIFIIIYIQVLKGAGHYLRERIVCVTAEKFEGIYEGGHTDEQLLDFMSSRLFVFICVYVCVCECVCVCMCVCVCTYACLCVLGESHK